MKNIYLRNRKKTSADLTIAETILYAYMLLEEVY